MKPTMVPPRTPMQVSEEDFPNRIRVRIDPEGSLLLSERFGGWTCRITPWPQLSYEVRFAGSRGWQPVDHGMVDLRSLLNLADKARQSAGGQLAMFHEYPVHSGNWAPLWPRFAAPIPSHLRSLIHECREGHWQLLRLICRLGAMARDYLAAGDHALLFALAHANRFVGHAVTMEDVPGLCGQPRHKVLGCLGFPDRPSTARLFRKMRLSACTVEDLLLLRDEMTGSTWASDSTLHHLPSINFLTLYIWLSPTFRPLCDASFLHEISRMGDEELEDTQATLLAVDFMAEEDELWDDVTPFRSVSQLRRCWEELYHDREDRDMDREFPAPPVRPVRGRDPWRPLCSAQELRQEAEYMGHCAERYISPVPRAAATYTPSKVPGLPTGRPHCFVGMGKANGEWRRSAPAGTNRSSPRPWPWLSHSPKRQGKPKCQGLPVSLCQRRPWHECRHRPGLYDHGTARILPHPDRRSSRRRPQGLRCFVPRQ